MSEPRIVSPTRNIEIESAKSLALLCRALRHT
jgi:hypothetical protein